MIGLLKPEMESSLFITKAWSEQEGEGLGKIPFINTDTASELLFSNPVNNANTVKIQEPIQRRF